MCPATHSTAKDTNTDRTKYLHDTLSTPTSMRIHLFSQIKIDRERERVREGEMGVVRERGRGREREKESERESGNTVFF